jgi:hypothetical protein
MTAQFKKVIALRLSVDCVTLAQDTLMLRKRCNHLAKELSDDKEMLKALGDLEDYLRKAHGIIINQALALVQCK